MPSKQAKNTSLLGALAATLLATNAFAAGFDVPGGSLEAALDAYSRQSGVQLMVPSDLVRSVRSAGVKGNLPAAEALTRILSGTGFTARRDSSGVLGIVRELHSQNDVEPLQLAQAAASPMRGIETVTVTSSKLGGADVQSIPIAITALSQEQLTATQTAGGPDLVKQVPNLTFTKTNFTGYSIQIRGIGTQAISVTTDPAVAVAFNDVPFIRNHFFEQEFYDLAQAEILRGPQGTLYGRNATAGVVNLISAKPTDQFEAMASGEIGTYHQKRFEAMLNLPIVDDRADLRIAGEWTKRQGYSFDTLTNSRIDGRDLWSGRVTLGLKPLENLQAYFVWEHFSENDDRMRTSKQLCKTAPLPTEIRGVPVLPPGGGFFDTSGHLSQSCEMTSLYSPDAFQVPEGFSLPYYEGLDDVNRFASPYVSATQSTNLRIIESQITPHYRAKNDMIELNADYKIIPALTFVSQTAFSNDFLYSAEDFNRFAAAPGTIIDESNGISSHANSRGEVTPDGGVTCYGRAGSCTSSTLPCGAGSGLSEECFQPTGIFCDPQLGCSDRLLAEDLAEEHSWQLSQEFRASSDFGGPFNFSVGGNYLHYETEENYYVFINTLTMYAVSGGATSGALPSPYIPGVTDNRECIGYGPQGSNLQYPVPSEGGGNAGSVCPFIDNNPISRLNNLGHNYFLSQNPYALNSYAAFGEVYYNILSDLKMTAGLRWTEDQKHFTDIPSELLASGWGYPATGVVKQQWDQFTGRTNLTWTPKLVFTDQSLFYGSYAHGYKAGGANPPGAVLLQVGAYDTLDPIHPVTFKPEFIDAFEIGTKNTLLDGALTLNADLFYFNYENYQISEIVDRTAINLNFDAHVKGAEVEGSWEPMPGLRLNFAGGWEKTAIARGSKAVDLMDRTAGNPDWVVYKPNITQASNCIAPIYVLLAVQKIIHNPAFGCEEAYNAHLDPVTNLPYVPNPTYVVATSEGSVVQTYPGFDPLAGTPGDPYVGQNVDSNGHDYGPASNNGEGFDKDLSHNELPNAPPLTVSVGAQYTMPLVPDWAGTLRADYYWQDYSWARVFNDNPYDRLRGYTNVNLSLIFTSQSGWQIMLYDKNVFNTTDITGAFLNSDDTGLTTNVFLTDPKLIGVRVTKNW